MPDLESNSSLVWLRVCPNPKEVAEIGIVLSDYGTLLRVFNKLVALFFKKMCAGFPLLNPRISNLGFVLDGHPVTDGRL